MPIGISIKTPCASGLVVSLALAAHGDRGGLDQQIEDIVTLIEAMDPAAFTVPAKMRHSPMPKYASSTPLS